MKDIHNYFFGQIPEMPWRKNKMKRIILDFKDTNNRISPDILKKMEDDIVNYLFHDYPELFEDSFNQEDDKEEVEILGIEIESHSYVEFKDVFE